MWDYLECDAPRKIVHITYYGPQSLYAFVSLEKDFCPPFSYAPATTATPKTSLGKERAGTMACSERVTLHTACCMLHAAYADPQERHLRRGAHQAAGWGDLPTIFLE
jgi:purine nucleoside phosphorylase